MLSSPSAITITRGLKGALKGTLTGSIASERRQGDGSYGVAKLMLLFLIDRKVLLEG